MKTVNTDSYIRSLEVLEGLLKFLPEGTYLLRDKGANRFNISSKENKISFGYIYELKYNMLLPYGCSNPSIYEIGKIIYKFLIGLDNSVPLDAVMFSLPINYSNIKVEEPKFGVYWLISK